MDSVISRWSMVGIYFFYFMHMAYVLEENGAASLSQDFSLGRDSPMTKDKGELC